MKRALDSLRDCLFDAFANPGWEDPQDPHQLWAIREGPRRAESRDFRWQEVQARKEHTCMRGHTIQPGEIYFQHAIGLGWGDDWKFCAGCTAMILYFLHVDEMPPLGFTHWDREAKKAVYIEV